MTTTYADSGVNVDLGDKASDVLYIAARETWKNRAGGLGELIVPFDDFTGVRAIDASGLPAGTLMNLGFDGVGTKIEIAERVGDHRSIAHDLFAMVCDDAVVRGAEPVLVGSILDVASLGSKTTSHLDLIKHLGMGYISAAREANVAVVNGEVAELGLRVAGHGSDAFLLQLAHHYISVNLRQDNMESIRDLSTYLSTSEAEKKKEILSRMDSPERDFVTNYEKSRTFNYNWGAAVVWFARRDRLFTGSEIKEGDYLIGLKEEGFRSNGISLVRKILSDKYGDHWHEREWSHDEQFGQAALRPSRIYTRAAVEMFGGYSREPRAEIHGIAHITGGGLPGKIGRMLKKSKLGATLDKPFEPSPLMLHCQFLGKVGDTESYKTWNMGTGMVIATPDVPNVVSIAANHGIEAQPIGRVTAEQGIRIVSKGYHRKGDMLEFKVDYT